MKLWVGLSLYGVGLAVLAGLGGRFSRSPVSVAIGGALFGTNLVLLDRGMPADQRMLPCLVAGTVAGVAVVAWDIGKNSRP